MISWKAVIILFTNFKSNADIFYDISHRCKNVAELIRKELPQNLRAMLIFLRVTRVVV
jgi:uncharacterized membrane protein